MFAAGQSLRQLRFSEVTGAPGVRILGHGGIKVTANLIPDDETD